MVEIEVPNSSRDVYLAVASMFWRSPWLWALLILVIAPPLYQVASGNASLSDYRSTISIWLLLLAFMIFVIPYITVWRQLKTGKSLQGPLKYTLSETGIDVRGPSTSGHYDWSTVYKVRETGPFILFYTSAVSMLVIPKRCVANAASITSVRELVRAHVSQRVSLRHN
jgi:hypothetical protein